MSSERIVPYYSEDIVASVAGTTITDKLNIGPVTNITERLNDQDVSNPEQIRFNAKWIPKYIINRGPIISAKGGFTIIGETVEDTSVYTMGYADIVNGTAGVCPRWTGNGGCPVLFLPNSDSVQSLPLNRCLESEMCNINGTPIPGYTPSMKLALSHFASWRQKAGEDRGVFLNDDYYYYEYFAPVMPLLHKSWDKSDKGFSLNNTPDAYPYKSNITEEPHPKNVLAKRNAQLGPYTSTFTNISNNQSVELDSVYVRGIQLPFVKGTSQLYWGPLKQVVTFTKRWEEPLMHPLFKFNDYDTNLYLSNVHDFSYTANVKTHRLFRSSNSYKQLASSGPNVNNAYVFNNLQGNELADVVGNNKLTSVTPSLTDWRLDFIKTTISDQIAKTPSTIIPFFISLPVPVTVSNFAASTTLHFPVQTLGSCPYYLLIESYITNPSKPYAADRGCEFENLSIALGSDNSTLANFNRSEIQKMTQKNGMRYNWKDEVVTDCLPSFEDIQDSLSVVQTKKCFNFYNNMYESGLAGIAFTKPEADATGLYKRPELGFQFPMKKNCRHAGDIILLNFVTDIPSLSHGLTAGTNASQIQIGIKLDAVPIHGSIESTDTLIVNAHFMNKNNLMLNGPLKGATPVTELFTMQEVQNAIGQIRNKKITLTSDLLVGGGLQGSGFGNFPKMIMKFLPKIRSFLKTAGPIANDVADMASKHSSVHPAVGAVSDGFKALNFGSA